MNLKSLFNFGAPVIIGALAGTIILTSTNFLGVIHNKQKTEIALLEFSSPTNNLFHVIKIPEKSDTSCLSDAEEIINQEKTNKDFSIKLSCVILNFPGIPNSIVSFTKPLPKEWTQF